MPEEDGGSLFDRMEEDTYITVHRRDDINKDWVFHGKLTPQEAALETLAMMFGGGTYRCQEKVRDSMSGSWRIGRTRTVKVGGAYRPPTGLLPGAKDEAKAATAPGTAMVPTGGTPDVMGAGILQLFQASATQQQMMMQMFSASQQQQSALLQAIMKGHDNKLDIAALITAVAPIVQKFLEQPRQERDPLDMLKAVGDIVRQNTGPQSNLADTLGTLRELLDFKDMLAGGGGSGDPMMDALPKLVEVIAEEQQARKAGLAPQAPRPAPAAPAVTPGASGPSPAQVAMPAWEKIIRTQGARLLSEARAGRDPGLVAEVAWAWAPEGIKPVLAEFFEREDCQEQLLRLVPGLPPEFAGEFCAEAQELIFGEDEPEATPPEATPDGGDLSGEEAPDAGQEG